MGSYTDYIKIGEILKSPRKIDEKFEYILKCRQHGSCFILETSFAFPCSECSCSDIKESNCLQIIDDMDDEDEDQNITLIYETADPLNGEDEVVNEEYVLAEPDVDSDHPSEVLSKSPEPEELICYSNETSSEFAETDNERMSSNDKDKSGSSTFVRNFMKSEQNVKAFIEAYKNQPVLWNQDLPQHSLEKDKQKYLLKIRKELKDKLHLQLSKTQVSRLISYIHRTLRVHMARLKLENNQHKEKRRKEEWFLNELIFLKQFECSKNIVKQKSQQCELETNNMREILGIYERYPCLWNTNLIENCCKNKRKEAERMMLNTINAEMKLNIDEDVLKKYIHLIHNRLTKEKRHQIRNDGKLSKDRQDIFKDMKFLYDHVGPFKCPVCSVELKNPLYFKVHKAQHDGSTPLKCSLCSKEFKILGTYVLHARRHMDDLEEICKECGKKFINPYELKVHMRFHTGSKPFCCEVCGVSFRHIQTFAAHKRRHEKKYLHTCPTCSKGFYSKAKLEDHIRSHKQIREFVCKTCGKAFITKKTMQQHQVTHEDVRKHICSLCSKTFKLKVGLTQHMKTHGSLIYERSDVILS